MEEATDGLAAQNMLAEGGYRVIYKQAPLSEPLLT
jgi:hypothetical protein